MVLKEKKPRKKITENGEDGSIEGVDREVAQNWDQCYKTLAWPDCDRTNLHSSAVFAVIFVELARCLSQRTHQGCQIFRDTTYQKRRKTYQNSTKYNKYLLNITNSRKRDQMFIK
jgi:hypothetical protein